MTDRRADAERQKRNERNSRKLDFLSGKGVLCSFSPSKPQQKKEKEFNKLNSKKKELK